MAAETRPEPVFAPDLPADVRRLLDRKPEMLVPAGQPKPSRQTSWSVEPMATLGQVLHEQSVLRARQREVARGMATAELEAVLGPQRRALVRSADVMKRKVQLLERYAERVRSADAALRAEAALEDGDRYIELLA